MHLSQRLEGSEKRPLQRHWLRVTHALDMMSLQSTWTHRTAASPIFGPDYDRGDPSVDNLVRHLVGRPKGEFHDLAIEVEEGIDLIPSHNMLEDLHEFLLNEKNQAENFGESYSMYHQLHRVLSEANVRDKYDVVIVDSAGKAGPILYNALVAVRNVVIPFEATAKDRNQLRALMILSKAQRRVSILMLECLRSS